MGQISGRMSKSEVSISRHDPSEVDKKQASARLERKRMHPKDGTILYMGDHPWQTLDEYIAAALERKQTELQIWVHGVDMDTPVGYNGIHDKE